MKIVTIVRTRDEEKNISAFCQSYNWSDKILIGDGGSLDRTVEIAEKLPKVVVREYPIRIPMENGLWRNPHGAHINFLIDWARFWENADWIVFADADQRLTKGLREQAREIIENTEKDFIYTPIVHFWGTDRYFPQLSCPGGEGKWGKIAWAFRATGKIHYRCDHPEHLQELVTVPTDDQILYLEPPYAQLHYGWPTPGEAQRKVDFYRRSGQIPEMLDVLDFAGAPAPKLHWMSET